MGRKRKERPDSREPVDSQEVASSSEPVDTEDIQQRNIFYPFYDDKVRQFFCPLTVVPIERILNDARDAHRYTPNIHFVFTPILMAIPEPVVLWAHSFKCDKLLRDPLYLSRRDIEIVMYTLSVHALCELSYVKGRGIRYDLCEKYKVSAEVEERLCGTYEADIKRFWSEFNAFIRRTLEQSVIYRPEPDWSTAGDRLLDWWGSGYYYDKSESVI